MPERSWLPGACSAGVDVLVTAKTDGGGWLVLSGGGGMVRCWPVGEGISAGMPVCVYPGDGLGSVRALGLTRLPDGRDSVVGRAEGGELVRWDLARGQSPEVTLRRSELDLAERERMAVSAAGALAVVNSPGGALQAWDVAGMTESGREFGTSVRSFTVGEFPDGAPVVVSGGADGLVRRWDPVTGEEVGPPISGCGLAVSVSIAVLPGGRRVACVLSGKGSIHRRDLVTGEPVGKPFRSGWRPTGYVQVCSGLLAVGGAGDGGVIAACTDGRSVQAWDLQSGAALWNSPGTGARVTGLGFARRPGGEPVFVWGDSDGQVTEADAVSGRADAPAVWPHGQAAEVAAACMLPGGRVVVPAASGALLRSFDVGTGEPVGSPWRTPVLGLSSVLLPDGRVAEAAAVLDGVACGELLSGSRRWSWTGTTMWDVAVAVVHGGRAVVAGAGQDSRVYRWDWETGELLGEPLRGHEASVKAVTVARQADGRPMLVTACDAGQVLRWDAATGAPVGLPLARMSDQAYGLAVVDLRDGSQVLAGVDYGTLYRWDPVSGARLGPPADVGERPDIVAAFLDEHGVPTLFLQVRGEDDRDGGYAARWRLDTGKRSGPRLAGTLRAAYRGPQGTRLIFAQQDGSLVIQPS